MRRTLAVLAGVAVAASTAVAAPSAQAASTISGGGASFPYPFLSACVADFNAVQSGFDVQYTSTGSGTGKSSFAKGLFAYAQTDSAYTSGEPSFGWEYVPTIGGAIAFPINLKNARTGRSLGSSIQLRQTTLAKLLSGSLRTWRAPEILKDNPRIATAIPDLPVTIVYRSGNSGTSNNALQYLNAWAPSIWSKVQDDFSTAFAGGRPPASSVAGKDSAAVVALVDSKPGTIGYVDYSDAKGYPVARIQNARGEFVAPSAASAARNLANQTRVAGNGLITLDYKVNVQGAYPAAIFSYGLARTDGKAQDGPGVRAFFDYVIRKCGPAKAAALGYVPISGKVLETAKALVARIR